MAARVVISTGSGGARRVATVRLGCGPVLPRGRDVIAPATWHTVAQGESVESVAVRAGHRWETLWEHPSNAPLRAARRSPHVLMPGDRVFVPPLEKKALDADTTRRHRFRCENVPSRLRLRFLLGDEPRANAAYVLTVDGERVAGVTDGDGRIDVPVHPLAERAELEFTDPRRSHARRRFSFRLRGLDPADQDAGLAARLRLLGYADPGPAAEARAADAVASFQEANGLPATGEADDATLDALRRRTAG